MATYRKRLLHNNGIVRSMFLLFLILNLSLVFGNGAAQAAEADDGARASSLGQDPGRQVLARNDGWAAAEGGTTGGANAANAQVYTVTSREELIQALGGDNSGSDTTPKIISIKGTINGNEADTGQALTCGDYETDGYSLASYLQVYDPEVWGRTTVPSGPLEDARRASALQQSARVKIIIPSNTTIIGAQAGARVLGANFVIKNVSNIIIRNIQFENAVDCFPQWDPTDGSTGNWNAAYDNVSVIGSTHIWIDHNSFTDGSYPDSQEPTYFDRHDQQHDGELDVTNGADLATISWNRFADHDKTMLIGSTDKPTYDVGKLRVTIHHNEFANTIQRLPRVRYGQVHVYNNYYNQAANASFSYALGVGMASQIFEQSNYYQMPAGFDAARIISVLKGTAVYTEDDLVNGEPVDLLAAYNAVNDPDLSGDVGWTPQFYCQIDAVENVPDLVRSNAGAGRTIVVSQDGNGTFTSVQAAINDIPANNVTNTTIAIAAGVYREVVTISANKPYITLRGGTRRPEDTVITYDNWSGSPAPGGGTLGTSGSATATFNASNFVARFLTFANTFDPAAHPETNQHQAVAVKTAGDRMLFDHDRFLGNQDTLYANSPGTTSPGRQLFTNSYVEGTVDFIFGRATAVFDRDTIFIKDRVEAKMTAASTPGAQPYGFLFIHCFVASSAPVGSVYLGRPWPATADASAQVTVRDSWLPAAISDAPWQSWTSPPLDWRTVRYAEYRNLGPGAGVNANRPQLTAEQAVGQTPFHYLVGQDHWEPD
jgi:pectate lyase